MAVIQGADIKIELYLSGAWTDLTCDTTSAKWEWGAPEALGPLTECEGGTLRVSVYDPTRKYDPDNPSSPLLGQLKVGLGMRVTVDAAPAWTGVLQTWGWDRGSKIADLNGMDPIGQLSMRALPADQALLEAPNAVTSAVQAQFLMDVVEWPTAKRVFPNGTAGWTRGNHKVEGSALDGLGQIRFAELGQLYPLRDGRIGWHDRAGPAPPASSAIINCGGVGLTDMWKAMGLGRLRNRIVISEYNATWGPILPPDEYRTVTASVFFLQFAAGAYGVDPPAEWAYWILDRLNPPPTLTVLGTILPKGAEVKQITTSEFGARWTVKVTGQPDTLVQLFGMTVTVEPGWIEVDVVTEDVVTPKPVLAAGADVTSGYLTSESSQYLWARTGPATAVATGGPGSATLYVGQYNQAGPVYGVHEGFVTFDTSSIPVGATITKAVLAATFGPQWPGAGPNITWVHFTIQARSYPSGGWRPTLALADWIPGENLGSYPLRATLDTARAAQALGTFAGSGGGSFEFTDVSLAAAIQKGGFTQLLLVSSRTVAGTGPASTNHYEDVGVSMVRLRVYYTP